MPFSRCWMKRTSIRQYTFLHKRFHTGEEQKLFLLCNQLMFLASKWKSVDLLFWLNLIWVWSVLKWIALTYSSWINQWFCLWNIAESFMSVTMINCYLERSHCSFHAKQENKQMWTSLGWSYRKRKSWHFNC